MAEEAKAVEVVRLSDLPRPFPLQQWGIWWFKSKNLTLNGNGYEIDLETIDTSASMLDWLIQVAGKKWVKPADVADLVRAFNDIFRPQMTLCSFGFEKGRHGFGTEAARQYADVLAKGVDDRPGTWPVPTVVE